LHRAEPIRYIEPQRQRSAELLEHGSCSRKISVPTPTGLPSGSADAIVLAFLGLALVSVAECHAAGRHSYLTGPSPRLIGTINCNRAVAGTYACHLRYFGCLGCTFAEFWCTSEAVIVRPRRRATSRLQHNCILFRCVAPSARAGTISRRVFAPPFYSR
jgi:hypothetical protein